MKQCTECDERYDDAQKFCEEDGTPLVDEAALLRAAFQLSAAKSTGLSTSQMAWLTGGIGVAAGILICLCVYTFTANSETPAPVEQTGSIATRQPRVSDRPTRMVQEPTPETTPLPSDDDSAAENPEETATEAAANAAANSTADAPAAAQNKNVAARLDDGPVSTSSGGDNRDGERAQVMIELKDGTSLQVDAAWKEGQSIWYKRGGLITEVEGSRVSAVTTVRPSSQPSPTP